MERMDDDEPVEVPIDGVLDLHTFHPSEVADLVATYLDECAAKGIQEVRLIHGKGTGTLRTIVQSVLERHPRVARFRTGREGEGAWGATIATLHL
jgi:dsDNA-specific endonuclease/ATPase MutS2